MCGSFARWSTIYRACCAWERKEVPGRSENRHTLDRGCIGTVDAGNEIHSLHHWDGKEARKMSHTPSPKGGMVFR